MEAQRNLDSQQNLDSLQARITDLEAQNHELRRDGASTSDAVTPRNGWARSALAAALITVSVITAPVAVLGTWARVQLVDTEHFVQTLAPLANEPAVQSFVADQVVQSIDESLNIDALVGDAFSGLAGLNLPPKSAAALALLEGPAAEGARSLVSTGVERVVTSPQFAQIWEATLRETHRRSIAVIQNDPDTALKLSDDGTLSLRLNVVIRQVKQMLVDQGLGFADRIPEINRSIPILASDSLVPVRTVYNIAVTAGYWLPWAGVVTLGLGIAVARRRTRALAWACVGLTLALLLLAAGLEIGKQLFVSTVTPSIMPAATATVMFDHLTALIPSTILALVMLSLLVAAGAWLAGDGSPARAVRGALDRGFGAARASADRHGLSTRGFGRFVDRWHSAIVMATAAIGVIVLFFDRPPTIGSGVTTLLAVLVVLAVVELVRRPAAAGAGEGSPAASEGSERAGELVAAEDSTGQADKT